MYRQFLVFTLISSLIFICVATNYDITTSTSNWQSILSGLQAGDVATIHAGTYTTSGSGFQLSLQGTPSSPIIIQGAAGETRPVIQSSSAGLSAQNVLDVYGYNFLIKGIGFSQGSQGVRIGPSLAGNITFDDIQVFYTTGPAVIASDGGIEYFNITIKNSEFTNTSAYAQTTGECMLLGCTSDECRIRDSLIENNFCHDTLGASSGSGAGYLIQTGSFNNVIRNNVCFNTDGPCVVVYDDYDRGANEIDSNVAINSGVSNNAIQATAGATIINNIVFSPNDAGIAITTDSLALGKNVRNINIESNSVYRSISDSCLHLDLTSSVSNIVVANNAFFCDTNKAIYSSSSLSGITFVNNGVSGSVSSGVQSGGTFNLGSSVSNVFANVSAYNLYPAMNSALINAGSATYQPSSDFNGNSRSSLNPTVGAYQYSSPSNPGCAVGDFFQCSVSSNPTNSYTPSRSITSSSSPSPSLYSTRTPTPTSTSIHSSSASLLCVEFLIIFFVFMLF